ncbi:MAG: cyclic nucleotide-binding domain-containing protein [Hymenobacteraceae bacterium]|nr:cyclic nucleotide-binding domain-containing protein [Hymenobacteraceae bacterium]MDX5481323.1 cyclic nucleotide-binding domain-containing protein [Hymenobacteraceae bacterium]
MEHIRNIIMGELKLSEEHFERFIGSGKMIDLPKKEFLIKAGTTCTFIGFVEEGVLRSFFQKGGDEFNLDFYLSASFVSAYTSFLTQLPTHGSIQALADSRVFLVSHAAYHELLREDDSWYRLGKYLSDSLFIRKCRREASLLVDSALERHRLLLQAYPTIEQLVPQYHIASYLGIQPESLSRIKSLTYIKEQVR